TTPGATDVPMLGIDFSVQAGYAYLSGLKVKKFVNVSGKTLVPDDKVTLKAYVDANGNNQVDAGETLLGSASFSSNLANLIFSPQTVPTSPPLKILLAVDIASDADPTHWLALKVDSPADVTITSVADKSSANYPLSNTQDIPLPVQVVGIKAEVNGNVVKLKIKTQVERGDFVGFNIYRSKDNDKYVLVGSYVNNSSLKAKGLGPYGGEYEFVDKVVESGKYYYKIEAVGRGESREVEVINVDIEIPKRYVLHQNYPNPFNPTTTIEFELPVSANVVLELYNISGQKVRELFNGKLPAGYHKVVVDGRDLASGVYFYVLKANDFVGVKKMVLVK
ncbi:MAG: T9SS type A sorting domain-containing protein, partial [Candidatus Kryptonium sp.]